MRKFLTTDVHFQMHIITKCNERTNEKRNKKGQNSPAKKSVGRSVENIGRFHVTLLNSKIQN